LRARSAVALAGITPEALVFVAAVPVVFLHLKYQPSVEIDIGSTDVGIQLSDVAVLAVVAAAITSGRRRGFAPLRAAWPLWVAMGLLFGWIGIEIVLPTLSGGYPWQKHGITALKFFEYALLAPAVVLLVQRRPNLRLLAGVLVAWSMVATTVGLVQFFGADIFVSGARGGRQLSFLGFHDFAGLSAAALVVGCAGIALPRLSVRRFRFAAVASGALGVILSASIAAVVGLALAAVALLVLAQLRRELFPRRIVAVGAVLAVAIAGTIAMRGSELDSFFRFVGLKPEQESSAVQTYAHRTVLAWIGWQIFLDHPLAGVGWEASGDPDEFMPYVDAAKREFPDEPALAFPSPQRRYGVQNLYVQSLADMGALGFVFLAAVFLTATMLALRRRTDWAVVGLLWTAVAAGLWLAQGIVAGIPLDAVTWLGFGLAATAAAQRTSVGAQEEWRP
jgi:O-antigen ligase